MSNAAQFAIIAALPREVAALVRDARPHADAVLRGVHAYRLDRAIVVAAGMGATRAALAVEYALASAPESVLVSVGLAGACAPAYAPGSVLEAASVVDTHTGERYETDRPPGNTLVVATSSTIASVQEKTRLAAAYGAALVDMEAATVARLARAHGVRFRCIKAVSDAHDFELAAMSRFVSPHGHFRMGAFALHTALRPLHWRKTARLGRNSQRALQALTEHLHELIAGCV